MLSVRFKNELKKNPALGPLIHFAKQTRFKSQAKQLEKTLLPRIVIVELTNLCNLKCAKCPTYETKRGKGMMEEATYKKILSDIEKAGAPTTLHLNGAGEALLHEGLISFMQLAHKVPNIKGIGFITNGLGLTPELSKQLLDSGLTDLKVSLDATDRETYLKFNRVDGYDQVVANIIEFCKLKREGKYPCQVTMKVTLYKEDRELIERIRSKWASHVDRIRMTRLHNWLGLRGKRKERERSTACEMIWTQVQILWNGQITLCCFDNMEGFFNMGNVNEMNLSEYWKSNPRLLSIRKQHLKNDFTQLPMCATCNADLYETIELFD